MDLSTPSGAATTITADAGSSSRAYYIEIFVASFAALLLEISYTRVISFKLFFYYTYLVIGLALLGIGSGGVIVTISNRVRSASTSAILKWSLLLGGFSVGAGYLIVARTSLDTFAVWQYGTGASVSNFVRLVIICLALSAPFVAVGVVLSTLFGRAPERIGRLYFADLFGAGLACAVVVSLIGSIGADATIFLAGVLLSLAGVRILLLDRSSVLLVALAAAVTAVLVAGLADPDLLPQQRLEASKASLFGKKFSYSSWSPIFRVDVTAELPHNPDVRFLYHDGLIGSAIYRWDGDVASLSRYKFESDVRVLPFSIPRTPPAEELIIGAAGGHEVLSSLYFKAGHIDAVELNPVTYSLVKGKFAVYDGHLADNPTVNYVKADGRSYLARSDKKYDLIWYPAPDSYSATNASTAGAFVLSESYLYTSNAIADSLKHLGGGGLLAAQFGELNYDRKPNRTTRYVSTVRQALSKRGISRPADHIIVATSPQPLSIGGAVLSTILVRNEPFTPAEVDRFTKALDGIPDSSLRYAPGHADTPNSVTRVAASTNAQLSQFYGSYPYNVGPISDNAPFFWHFTPFGTVMRNFTQSISRSNAFDREDTVGERVLLLLFMVATLLAAVFLLLPFVAIRRTWTALPRKARSGLYFAALGFGFIFFEITLIQRLTLFLGYPTYSLTVTLMSILIFAGIGALLSGRLKHRVRQGLPVLAVAIAALTAFYLFGLTPMTNALIGLPLAARVPIAFLVLAPLGISLGTFMPIGLGTVAALSSHEREYVAWSWAVNGFATVIGSVLSTILAMTFGFQVVLALALVIYMVALLSLRGLVGSKASAIVAGPTGPAVATSATSVSAER